MKVTEASFFKSFVRMADDGSNMGWHERNGGNLSYRLTPCDVKEVEDSLDFSGEYKPIGATVEKLAGEYFLITGSGKYFSRVKEAPEDTLALIQVDESGKNYKLLWGLVNGGRPTSELPTHLMNHEIKLIAGKEHRVIYHCHPVNIIALTFVLPLDDKTFTRELWETMTECPIIFPDGVGVVPWMVPGGEEIAIASCKKMAKYDVLIWAHHGLFCSGEDFDTTFELTHTVEKSADILVKVRSMAQKRLQSITPDDFRQLAKDFGITIEENFLS